MPEAPQAWTRLKEQGWNQHEHQGFVQGEGDTAKSEPNTLYSCASDRHAVWPGVRIDVSIP